MWGRKFTHLKCRFLKFYVPLLCMMPACKRRWRFHNEAESEMAGWRGETHFWLVISPKVIWRTGWIFLSSACLLPRFFSFLCFSVFPLTATTRGIAFPSWSACCLSRENGFYGSEKWSKIGYCFYFFFVLLVCSFFGEPTNRKLRLSQPSITQRTKTVCFSFLRSIVLRGKKQWPAETRWFLSRLRNESLWSSQNFALCCCSCILHSSLHSSSALFPREPLFHKRRVDIAKPSHSTFDCVRGGVFLTSNGPTGQLASSCE